MTEILENEDTPLQFLQRRRRAAIEKKTRWSEVIKDIDTAILLLETQNEPKKAAPRRKPTPKDQLKNKPFKHVPFY